MKEDEQDPHQHWLSRWRENRIGWHEGEGNSRMRKWWPGVPKGGRVLVPLCGKTRDLLWLAEQGMAVVGVELAREAVELFFSENRIEYRQQRAGALTEYRAVDRPLALFQGDYFNFDAGPFDAVYDRASLIALPPELRPAYARHTSDLLAPGARQLLITLEYLQSQVEGPPYSVEDSEVLQYWPGLRCVAERDDLANCPPKFREAGLQQVVEKVWVL